VENTGPILSGQNVTLWFSMCSISTNILTVLANFLGIQNSISSQNIGHDCGNTSHARQWRMCADKDRTCGWDKKHSRYHDGTVPDQRMMMMDISPDADSTWMLTNN
jgi:hypothetical protein